MAIKDIAFAMLAASAAGTAMMAVAVAIGSQPAWLACSLLAVGVVTTLGGYVALRGEEEMGK